MRTMLALLSLAAAVAIGLTAAADPRPDHSPPRPHRGSCPHPHPSTGDPCSSVGQQCSYPCTREGPRSWGCTCGRADDGSVIWTCIGGPVCSS